MNIAAIAFSDTGMDLGRKLMQRQPGMTLERCPHGGLADWTQRHFAADDALVFIGSVGIAVRAIAPHVVSKISDPAVVVMDEMGTYAIPILSGHLGGANELAVTLSRQTGALAVVTTATDIHGLFAVDDWARKQGLQMANPERIKWVSARLLSGESIRYKSQYPIAGDVPAQWEMAEEGYDVLISHRARGRADALRLVPRCVTAGVGCRRGASEEAIAQAVDSALRKSGCHPLSLRCLATIDIKAKEPGLLAFCRSRELELVTYSAEELAEVEGSFTGSDFVRQTTGVDNVCERAAVRHSLGRLISRKEALSGVTVALALTTPELHF